MTGNPRAGQLPRAYPSRLSSVSGARPIEAVVPIEVQDTWLEFDDVPALQSSPPLERVVLELQLELERTKLAADARLAAVERERDAALATLARLRAEVEAVQAASAVPRQAEAPHMPPTMRPPTPHAPAARCEPTAVPTLSEVVVTTDPIGNEDDRRTERRIQREFELEFNYETHFFAGLSLDISTGGLFIATYHLLAKGTALSLSFQLPDGVRLSVRGEVRWVRCASEGHERPGMGVAFQGLSAEALEAITRFCAERPPLYMDL